MTKYVLYAHPGACSRVTMSALHEAQVDFDIEWVNLTTKQQKSAEYSALNRKSKVPLLIVDGKPLTENVAILNFIHTTYPEAKLLPDAATPFEQAIALSDLVWCGSMLHPMVRQIRAPEKWTTGETDGVREDGADKLKKECAYINERLQSSEWWYGEQWSIVDAYVYWVVSTAGRSGFSLDSYTGINAHAERVRARDSFKTSLAQEIAAIKDHDLQADAETL